MTTWPSGAGKLLCHGVPFTDDPVTSLVLKSTDVRTVNWHPSVRGLFITNSCMNCMVMLVLILWWTRLTSLVGDRCRWSVILACVRQLYIISRVNLPLPGLYQGWYVLMLSRLEAREGWSFLSRSSPHQPIVALIVSNRDYVLQRCYLSSLWTKSG